jgi:hypothetical protein
MSNLNPPASKHKVNRYITTKIIIGSNFSASLIHPQPFPGGALYATVLSIKTMYLDNIPNFFRNLPFQNYCLVINYIEILNLKP